MKRFDPIWFVYAALAISLTMIGWGMVHARPVGERNMPDNFWRIVEGK